MKNYVFFSVAVLSVALNAVAVVCSRIDLRNDVLGPARDQGQIGWCFAFTAADLISHRIGKRVSVSDLAMNYYRKFDGKAASEEYQKGFQESGGVGKALEVARDTGVCLEKDMPSNNFLTFDLRSGKISERVWNIPEVMSALTESALDETPEYYIHFPHVSKKQYLDLLETKTTHEAWATIVELSCRGRRLGVQGLNPKKPIISKLFPKHNFKVIHQQLEKGNIVGISYYSAFLKSKPRNIDAFHASSIVGRRWNRQTNKCEFLIRNSWGTSCSGYRSGFDCDNGNLWVPRDILEENVSYLNYIK